MGNHRLHYREACVSLDLRVAAGVCKVCGFGNIRARFSRRTTQVHHPYVDAPRKVLYACTDQRIRWPPVETLARATYRRPEAIALINPATKAGTGAQPLTKRFACCLAAEAGERARQRIELTLAQPTEGSRSVPLRVTTLANREHWPNSRQAGCKSLIRTGYAQRAGAHPLFTPRLTRRD